MVIHNDTNQFIQKLQLPGSPGDYLTLTAVHPGGRARAPSRHIPYGDTDALNRALSALAETNALGWHAYIGIAPRVASLGRWQRGGRADITRIGALFADLDDPLSTV